MRILSKGKIMCFEHFFRDLCGLPIWTSATFWSAVSAIAAVFAAIGVFWAAQQFKFSGWIRAQELYTQEDFVEARTEVLKHFGYKQDIKPYIDDETKQYALLVCRRMDQLARLEPYLGRKTILEVWGNQLGKAWMILQKTIDEERKYHKKKWDAFEHLGKVARSKFNLEKENIRQAEQKSEIQG
jgi:hypothetical protein